MIDELTLRKVERLLYREARLLDERKYDDWLELWAMDCRYHVPVRSNVAAKPGEGVIHIEGEMDSDTGMALVDDNKMLLFTRIARLKTGKAWCENPPSRSRRFVSNVEVYNGEKEQTYKVYSNLLQFRSRRDREEALFSSQRRDIIVQQGESLIFKERKVVLDSHVLNASYATFL